MNPARRWLEQSPWAAVEALRAGVIVGLGAVGLVVTWYGAARGRTVHDQVGWGTAAVLCVCVLFVGGIAWLVAGRRAVGLRAELLLGAPPSSVGVVAPRDGTMRVAIPGLHRYHRASCPLVAGKDVVAASTDEHLADDRRPCGVCSA